MELEFKAWDFINNKWLDIKSGGSNSEGKNYLIGHDGKLWELKEVTGGVEIHIVSAKVVQYSNKKDINGEKLFYGDIVKCFNIGFSVVKFINGSWGLETNLKFVPFFELGGHCEKIGNIYDGTLLN